MSPTYIAPSETTSSPAVATLREYPRAARPSTGPGRKRTPSRTRPNVQRIPASRPVQPPRPDTNFLYGARVPARVGVVEPIGIDGFGSVPTSASELPDAHSSMRFTVQSIMEVFAGRRNLLQVTRLLSEDVFKMLSERVGARPGLQKRSIKILRVTAQEPDDGVAEGVAVIEEAGDVYSIALRLEGLDGSWQCTVFEII